MGVNELCLLKAQAHPFLSVLKEHHDNRRKDTILSLVLSAPPVPFRYSFDETRPFWSWTDLG